MGGVWDGRGGVCACEGVAGFKLHDRSGWRYGVERFVSSSINFFLATGGCDLGWCRLDFLLYFAASSRGLVPSRIETAAILR